MDAARGAQNDPLLALSAIFELTVVALTISIASCAYKLALQPLYGSIPTSWNFGKLLSALVILGSQVPQLSRKYVPATLAGWFYLTPTLAHYVGRYTARSHDAIKGPLITHLWVFTPIPILVFNSARRVRAIHQSLPVQFRLPAALAGGAAISTVEELISKSAQPGGWVTSCNIFFLLGTAMLAPIALASRQTQPRTAQVGKKPKAKTAQPSAQTSSSLMLLIIPIAAALLSRTMRPCCHQTFPFTNANNTVRLLASELGPTGRIVVAENLDWGFRYLRADHSLLGGLWTDYPTSRGQAGDSIYTAFLLQEGARFANRPPKPAGEADRALIIGLGVGISANSFLRHGLHTTVVEIDPVVIDFATRFFGLRAPHAVHVADARAWVRSPVALGAPKFDIVVHDCFSGGAVPSHIFAAEFWADLKALVAPDGIVAVNFAGEIGSSSARAILATLLHSFKQCRVFHDRVEEFGEDEFLNMVFFCTSASQPLTFRQAVAADWFDSRMRERLFGAWAQLEISHEGIFGGDEDAMRDPRWVLTDANNALGRWQEASGLHHWKLMREIMPDEHWEAY